MPGTTGAGVVLATWRWLLSQLAQTDTAAWRWLAVAHPTGMLGFGRANLPPEPKLKSGRGAGKVTILVSRMETSTATGCDTGWA
ncbi:MAG: hypothetical protein AAB881_00025 [Patescibacteria group bacterium]